jgi:hypothetical protein
MSMIHYGLFGGVPATEDPRLLAPLAGYGRGLSKPPIAGASDLWAIGRVDLAEGEVVDMPITWPEMDQDIAWAAAMQDEMGLGAEDFCFYSFLYGQSAQFWPWMKAGFDRGARAGSGMPTAWDSYRLETFLRLFKLKLVFGISPQTLDGLEAAGHDIGKVFSTSELLAALPGAHERLTAKGFKPWRITWLGPILAVDPCDGTGGRFDTSQWTLDAENGEILVSSKPGRTARFDRARTGTRGRIETVDGQPRLFSL